MTDMQPKSTGVDNIRYWIYGALAVGEIIFIYYIYNFDPVNYIRLITEDQWAEYSTSLSFFICFVSFIFLACRPGPARERLVFALIAAAALFIAGEEISWGQRLFDLSVPEQLRQINQQDELTIHNIEAIRALRPHVVLAYLILGWAVFSVVCCRSARLDRMLKKTGLPAFPLPLIPLFLLYSAIYILQDAAGILELIRRDEISEWFLGIAVLVWSLDRVFVIGRGATEKGTVALLPVAGLSAMVITISIALPFNLPTDDFKYQLQRVAERGYPSRGMFEQSEQVYAYIYAHPQLLTSSTRINHGNLLLGLGRQEEAEQILLDALNILQSSSKRRASNLRRQGEIYDLLGHREQSISLYDEAIDVDRKNLDATSDLREKSKILMSIARTLEAKGDVDGALETAKQAEALAPSARVRWLIKRGYGF